MGTSPVQDRAAVLLAVGALVLRSRLVGAPRDALRRDSTDATAEEVERALRTGYLQQADGSKVLLVPQGARVVKVPLRTHSAAALAADATRFPRVPETHKPALDRTFVRQLVALVRIAVPGWTSAEAGLVGAHSLFLVLRTVLSVLVAQLDGRIVRDLVSANGRGFLKGLALWFALAIPSTYTNAMIKHLQASLALRLRTRLTRYIHDLYLSNTRYHRLGLDGVDQYLTSDVAAFCDALSVLYGNIMKPGLDIVLFTSQLSRALGVRGTLLMFINYYITARILRAATPAFGRLAAVEARLEGEFRAGMGRIGRESEEIAFYNGGQTERTILERAYLRLIRHINSIYKIRIAYEWTEDYVIKYLWSAAGYGLISIPYLVTRRTRELGVQAPAPTGPTDDAVADRTEGYISSRRLLLSLADAGGRLMYAYKDLLELAGLTTRLYALLSEMHALPALPAPVPSPALALAHVDVAVPADADADAPAHPPLVRDLTLRIEPGKHLFITGPNAAGKTAVARVLAGLWAPQGADATVARPARDEIFVVPQRAYMVAGSLLDQVIYPHTHAQFAASGRTEAELAGILAAVHLAYLPAREGGWGARKEWRDVLSGGEKQRMGLARVLYHRPRFAVLDECTSAVSSDVEGRMYEALKHAGITLITISLRPSLSKYHTSVLTLAGDGTWSVQAVGADAERMERAREIAALEARLAQVGTWEARVQELEALLGVQELDDEGSS